MKRRTAFTVLAGVAGCALAAPTPPSIPRSVFAQAYPARPINLIVPFPPGGNTDIMARALQNELGKALGQTVIVVNKGGAAGTLGLIDLSRAAPDGYTIALAPNNPLTAQPHVQKLPYTMESFRYVCLSYFAPYVLIAGPQVFRRVRGLRQGEAGNSHLWPCGPRQPTASRHACGAQGDRRRRAWR